VALSDSRLSTEYKFFLIVENRAPYFEQKLRDIKLSLNSDFRYKLPLITDKESLPVRVVISMEDGSRLPPNIMYNEGEQTFEISKTQRASSNDIKVCLDDNYASPNCYGFTIKFENIRVKD
jgi:hypothetical protein